MSSSFFDCGARRVRACENGASARAARVQRGRRAWAPLHLLGLDERDPLDPLQRRRLEHLRQHLCPLRLRRRLLFRRSLLILLRRHPTHPATAAHLRHLLRANGGHLGRVLSWRERHGAWRGERSPVSTRTLPCAARTTASSVRKAAADVTCRSHFAHKGSLSKTFVST